jgi:hypothetical protein
MRKNMTYQVNDAATPALKAMNRMVGTWKFSGDVNGETIFEWMEGGYFLIQHGTIEQGSEKHKSLEIIGQEKPSGAAEAVKDVTSHIFTDTGDTIKHTYELEGDTLTVWSGPKGSPAFSKSTFSEDGDVLSGKWQWPGGGYTFEMIRVK